VKGDGLKSLLSLILSKNILLKKTLVTFVFTDFHHITIENLLKGFLFIFLFKTTQLEKKGFDFHKTFLTSLSFNLNFLAIMFSLYKIKNNEIIFHCFFRYYFLLT